MFFRKLSLATQLILVFLLVFLLVVTLFGMYDYHQQVDNIKDAKLNALDAIAKSISASVNEDIYTNDYVRIEQKLSALNLVREIGGVSLYDANGVILADLSRNTSQVLSPTYQYGNSDVSLKKEFIAYSDDNNLTSVSAVYFSGRVIGWLEIRSPPVVINEIRLGIVIEFIIFSSILLIITCLTVIVFMKRRLSSLYELAEFAESLPAAKGAIIENENAPRELRSLMKSFSWASREIQNQYNELLAHNETLEVKVNERTKEFKEAKINAEKASQAKTEFMSRMSHELRTPLNAILGFSQLLEYERSALTSDQVESIKEIHDAGNHLLEMVNEILEIARVESGKYEVNMNEHDVALIINEVISLLKPLLMEKNISVNFMSSDNATINIYSDRLRTRQVILNVMSNAIKYNKNNGNIEIDIIQHDRRAAIQIRDTGEGIEENDLDRIFQPFERSNFSSVVEGAGIGLSISRQLMNAMGGDIQVESVPGVGSTFTLFFQSAIESKLSAEAL